ncbi:MAG TPA: hypothetical protein VHI13_16825 [Candidatus Kapabacteria bacterium]|nr:hypothetical protein [Candidatus Kapabacteria bacterium]
MVNPMYGGGNKVPTYYLKRVDTGGVISYAIKKADGTTAATDYAHASMLWDLLSKVDLETKDTGQLSSKLDQGHGGSKFRTFWKKFVKTSGTSTTTTSKDFPLITGSKVTTNASSSTGDLLLTLIVGDLDQDDTTMREVIALVHTVTPTSTESLDPDNPRKPAVEFVSVSELEADVTIPKELLPPAFYSQAADLTLGKLDSEGKKNIGFDYLYAEAA